MGDCLQDFDVRIDFEGIVLGLGGYFVVKIFVSHKLLDVEGLDAEVLLDELSELNIHSYIS